VYTKVHPVDTPKCKEKLSRMYGFVRSGQRDTLTWFPPMLTCTFDGP